MKTILASPLNIGFILLTCLGPIRASDQWENIAPFPAVFGYAVTHGNGKFVTIPGFGYSPDAGLTWHQGGSGAAILDNPPYLIFST